MPLRVAINGFGRLVLRSIIEHERRNIEGASALAQTQVMEGKLARVLAWGDNEWGFSTRMADVALAMASV